MRVKSEIWVTAYLRRCQGEGAGAIFICIDRLDGTVSLYGPAPSGLAESATDRRWVRCFGARLVSPTEADIYLARQRQFDPDLWIIEVEDRAGRHFLGDGAVEE